MRKAFLLNLCEPKKFQAQLPKHIATIIEMQHLKSLKNLLTAGTNPSPSSSRLNPSPTPSTQSTASTLSSASVRSSENDAVSTDGKSTGGEKSPTSLLVDNITSLMGASSSSSQPANHSFVITTIDNESYEYSSKQTTPVLSEIKTKKTVTLRSLHESTKRLTSLIQSNINRRSSTKSPSPFEKNVTSPSRVLKNCIYFKSKSRANFDFQK